MSELLESLLPDESRAACEANDAVHQTAATAQTVPAHTPLPWTYEPETEVIYGADGNIVADVAAYLPSDGARQDANAALIARAVNSHAALVEALERSLNWLCAYPGGGALGAYKQARAALALAKGEA